MQRHQLFLTSLLFCLIFSTGSFSQTLVKGDPPLTQRMVDNVIDFFEWSLGVHLSESQKGLVTQKLSSAWQANNRSEMEGTGQILALYDQLQKLSNDDLAKQRPEITDGIVKLLRGDPNDAVARMLLSAYESAPKAAPNASVSASSVPAPAVKVGPGDLYGIYIATTKQLVAPGPGSSVQYGLTWKPGRDWITFLPGGRVFKRLPDEGLENFDYNAAIRKYPPAEGSYVITGNIVRVSWPSGGGMTFKRTPDGELWQDSTNWTPLPKVSGLKLSGTWAVQWNEQSRERTITFTADGRFAEQGFLNMINWETQEIRQGSGTYNIRNNTLELRYTDGRVLHINFYVFADELKKPHPSVIYINSFDFSPL
jgi:hypothetical protein